MIESREWVFRVACQVDQEETVCIVGNCDSLGAWNSQRMVLLYPESQLVDEGGESIWSASVQVPLSGVEYRFCVCIVLDGVSDTDERILIVRRWESNLVPRKLKDGVTCPAEPQAQRFGSYGGYERVDQGWLVKDSVVQLRLCNSTLYNDPVMMFKKKYKDRKVLVKVTPVELDRGNPREPTIVGVEESTDFDLSNLRLNPKPVWPTMEVAVMSEGLCKFRSQEQFGIVCNTGDYIVFQCRMLKPETNTLCCVGDREEAAHISIWEATASYYYHYYLT